MRRGDGDLSASEADMRLRSTAGEGSGPRPQTCY